MATPEFHPTTLVKVVRMDQYGPANRAVVAVEDIPKGTVIESAPVIRIRQKEVFEDGENSVRNPTLSHYVFYLSPNYIALALGFGSLYNHNDEPNAEFELPTMDLWVLTATKDIKAGEEVTIHYEQSTGDPVEFNQSQPQ